MILLLAAIVALALLFSRKRETPEQRAARETLELYPALSRHAKRSANNERLNGVLIALIFVAIVAAILFNL